MDVYNLFPVPVESKTQACAHKHTHDELSQSVCIFQTPNNQELAENRWNSG